MNDDKTTDAAHEQLRMASNSIMDAVTEWAAAEVEFIDMQMRDRDQMRDVGFGRFAVDDIAGRCALTARSLRAQRAHSSAVAQMRAAEEDWFTWVAAKDGKRT